MPEVGRFASPDTIVPDPNNPQSFNRYSYVNNDPINYTDPSGNTPCVFDDSCGSFINIPTDARDLTPWIVSEANYLPTLPIGEFISRLLESDGYIYGYYIFYELVADGAPLDVKDSIFTSFGETIKLGDYWFEFSTPGNILYGFYGSAWGLHSVELHGGGGLAQLADFVRDSGTVLGPASMAFDDPTDYFAVDFGIQLYYEGYAPDSQLTIAEFEALLVNYEHLAEMAWLPAPTDFVTNPNWPYSPGYFNNDQNPLGFLVPRFE